MTLDSVESERGLSGGKLSVFCFTVGSNRRHQGMDREEDPRADGHGGRGRRHVRARPARRLRGQLRQSVLPKDDASQPDW